ncbi:MAG: uroporphyrinogen-III synthase [Alphaproteobacteria bacterium]
MSLPTLLVTRPKEDSEETAYLLAQKGFKSLLCPLLNYEALPEPPPLSPDYLAKLQAILATSQHAVHNLPKKNQLLSKPVYTVGAHSAQVAKSYGFQQVRNAQGSAEDLLKLVNKTCSPERGPLLYVSGESIRVDLPFLLSQRGFHVLHQILYRMTPILEFPFPVQEAFRHQKIQGVLLLSPQTSVCFSKCIQQASLGKNLKMVYLFCLSEAVAASLTLFQDVIVRIAPQPTLASLMEICHETFAS